MSTRRLDYFSIYQANFVQSIKTKSTNNMQQHYLMLALFALELRPTNDLIKRDCYDENDAFKKNRANIVKERA